MTKSRIKIVVEFEDGKGPTQELLKSQYEFSSLTLCQMVYIQLADHLRFAVNLLTYKDVEYAKRNAAADASATSPTVNNRSGD